VSVYCDVLIELICLYLPLGLLCDLLWSDPDKEVQGWGENDRGVSFTFGSDVVSKFLNRHDLDLICRAHQVCYKVLKISSLLCSLLTRSEKKNDLDNIFCLYLLLKMNIIQVQVNVN
jgi:hypothetical protein